MNAQLARPSGRSSVAMAAGGGERIIGTCGLAIAIDGATRGLAISARDWNAEAEESTRKMMSVAINNMLISDLTKGQGPEQGNVDYSRLRCPRSAHVHHNSCSLTFAAVTFAQLRRL